MQLTTGSVVDRYTVDGILGEGGMAVVYRVRHNQLGTHHALKVLTIASAQIAKRLVQEGRVQATLRHPNIVAVTDIVDLGGSPGLIMELVNGPSLDDFLVRESLSLEQVDALAAGILAGVASAHAQDLIHRDLKPANIMLSITPSGLVPKVTDFGLAKLLTGGGESSSTRTGSTMGTPHYMSPEQIRDSKNVGLPADVFSLGAILYEMVTQQRAFEGEDLLAIFNAVANGEYTPVRELRPEIPDRMERAIVGALKVDLADRIASVAELQAIWAGGETAAFPAPVAGPWDAAVMAKANQLSASGESEAPDPTGNPRAVEAVAEASMAARGAPTVPSDGSLVPVSGGASDSLVSARSLLIGVGSTAAVVGLGGVTLLAVVLVLGVVWQASDSGGFSAPAVEAVTEVEMGPEAAPEARSEPEVAPDVKPKASPRRVRTPVAPAPPEATPEPGPAQDAEPSEEETVEVDEVVGSVGEPEASEGEDTDVPLEAVAEAEEVSAPETPDLPEPAQPVTVPSDPLDALPADLRSQSTSVRMDGLTMREAQPDATWIYATVVRHDPHSEVRKKAWRIVLNRWRRGIGPKMEHQRIVAWMLGDGTSDQRIEGIDYVSRYGTDVNLLASTLDDPRTSVRRAAVTGISAMAPRTGQKVTARILLDDRAKVEADSKTATLIEKALSDL